MNRVIIIALVVAAVTARAEGAILPIVHDESAGGAFWWASSSTFPAGTFDEVMFEAAVGPESPWLSPLDVQPDGAVSRLFRRHDITLNNARSLAGLYGAHAVLYGRVYVEEAGEVPWLGLRRTTVAFEGSVVDVSSGVTVGVVSLRRTGHDASEPGQRATRQLAEAVVRLGAVISRAGGTQHSASAGDIVVHSPNGALPFVALRGAIRDVHPSVVDLSEVWATEGLVALRVVLDEGGSFDEVARSVTRLEGATIDGARVTRAEMLGGAVWVDVEGGASVGAADGGAL